MTSLPTLTLQTHTPSSYTPLVSIFKPELIFLTFIHYKHFKNMINALCLAEIRTRCLPGWHVPEEPLQLLEDEGVTRRQANVCRSMTFFLVFLWSSNYSKPCQRLARISFSTLI